MKPFCVKKMSGTADAHVQIKFSIGMGCGEKPMITWTLRLIQQAEGTSDGFKN